jgi:hypothetical protein
MPRANHKPIELRHAFAATGFAVLFVTWFPVRQASAEIMQGAAVRYDAGQSLLNQDAQMVTGQGTISRDILAEIRDPSAFASVGRFGEVGLSASIFSGPKDGSATMFSSVEVSNDEFRNRTPFTQGVQTKFVIDGGALMLNRSMSSELEFRMELERDDHRVFGADVRLVSDASGNPKLIAFGNDIGAYLDASRGVVTIPLSFQTADLGDLVPGQTMTLSYSARIDLTRGPGEGLEGSYSDPFHLSGHPVLGDVTFSPVTGSSVPEPSTFVLFGVGFGMAGLGAIYRRRAKPGWPAPESHQILSPQDSL